MTISDSRPPAQTSGAAPKDHFDTDHLKADLARRSARGGIVTVSAQALKLALQLCSTAILARLLTPADFGVVAAAMSVLIVAVGLGVRLGYGALLRGVIRRAQAWTAAPEAAGGA